MNAAIEETNPLATFPDKETQRANKGRKDAKASAPESKTSSCSACSNPSNSPSFVGASKSSHVPAQPATAADAASATANTATPAPTPAPDRAKIANKVAAIGIGGNIALSAFKLIAGVVGNSAAMLSDAVHSLSDVFATAIAFAGVRMAERDADAGHPYGHERLECVASLALGVILLATGLAIGGSGLDAVATRSYLNSASPSMIALVAAIVSIAAKEAMFWYTRHQARIINSSAFMADAWHHRSDAISSVGALIGIGAEMLGFRAGDELASIAIGIIIVKVAADVLKDAVGNMTDTPCDREEERAIKTCIAAVPGVERIDALRTRKFGNRIYVDVEIAADGDLPLREAHAIAEAAHDAVEEAFPDVKHVMVHENPA
jgi:cation diffusion facilitator family transporter